MLEGEFWNVVVLEFETGRGQATLTTTAVSESDDAIQLALDATSEQQIPIGQVTRLYSERKPSNKWVDYFAAKWPHVTVFWSFNPDQEAEFETAIQSLHEPRPKPWWKIW